MSEELRPSLRPSLAELGPSFTHLREGDRIVLAALTPLDDGFSHDPYSERCLCGPVVEHRGGWYVVRHAELLPTVRWESREVTVTVEGEPECP